MGAYFGHVGATRYGWRFSGGIVQGIRGPIQTLDFTYADSMLLICKQPLITQVLFFRQLLLVKVPIGDSKVTTAHFKLDGETCIHTSSIDEDKLFAQFKEGKSIYLQGHSRPYLVTQIMEHEENHGQFLWLEVFVTGLPR